MEAVEVKAVMDFMGRVRTDGRLGPAHISVYMAVVYVWVEQGANGPAKVTGKELGALAKISGQTPLYRRLRELHDFGYIVYQPSFNPADRSRVFLTLMEKMRYLWKG
jgi:hypothetical protein